MLLLPVVYTKCNCEYYALSNIIYWSDMNYYHSYWQHFFYNLIHHTFLTESVVLKSNHTQSCSENTSCTVINHRTIDHSCFSKQFPPFALICRSAYTCMSNNALTHWIDLQRSRNFVGNVLLKSIDVKHRYLGLHHMLLNVYLNNSNVRCHML